MPVMIIEKNVDYYKYQEAIINRSRQFVITEEQVNYPSTNPFAVMNKSKIEKTDKDKKQNTIQEEIGKEVISNIYFDFDKYNIKPAEMKKLKEAIRILKSKYSDKVIKVVGYTDWFGSEGYNDELARKRAYQVATLLWVAGLTVKPEWKGKCCYVSKDNPALNRRAEIIITDTTVKEVK